MRKILFMTLAFFALISSAQGQRAKVSRAQQELVDAERAFARYAVQNGVAESWMEFFADDGIIFRPGPVNSKDFYRSRVPSKRPFAFTLDWEPQYGDVSMGGDFGYSMGPWTLKNHQDPKEPDIHGMYFSIWRKLPEGRWKVAMDFGSGEIKDPNFDHRFGRPFTPARQYKAKVPRGSSSLTELEKLKDWDRALAQHQDSELLEKYLATLSDDAKTFRPGKPPADKQTLRSYIPAGTGASLTLNPMGGEIAKSVDLAYTYGSYELKEKGTSKEKGYYVHMWKRDQSGAWKIVVTNFTGAV